MSNFDRCSQCSLREIGQEESTRGGAWALLARTRSGSNPAASALATMRSPPAPSSGLLQWNVALFTHPRQHATGKEANPCPAIAFGLRGGLGFRGIFNHQRHLQRQQAASTSAMPSVDKRLKGLEPRPTTNSPQLGGNAAKMKASETWLVVGSHRNERPSQDVRSCRRTKIPTAAWPSETGCSSA